MTGLPGRGRRNDDSGATIVEFALVVPVLILITFAILEFGLAFFEYLTVERATNDGARVAAFSGTRPDADLTAVCAAADTLTGGMADRLVRIEVFQADSAGNQGATNTWLRLPDTAGAFDEQCPGGGFKWDVTENWASTSRQTFAPLDGSDPELDLIGVRVLVDRQWITGFGPFSGSYQINEFSLLRVEPELYQS